MNKYTVKFYYYTDLRTDWTGEAANEVAALVMAMNHHNIKEWANEKGFRIEIH